MRWSALSRYHAGEEVHQTLSTTDASRFAGLKQPLIERFSGEAMTTLRANSMVGELWEDPNQSSSHFEPTANSTLAAGEPV